MSSPTVDDPMGKAGQNNGERSTQPRVFRFKHSRWIRGYRYRIKKSKESNRSSSAYHFSMKDGMPVQNESSYDDPTLQDESSRKHSSLPVADESTSNTLNPDVAFRESLFEAMADDEGAQYWESVYGQPIHTYSRTKKGPTGELEQMNDEEYVAYVRAKMYEKTHQHLMEEKARRLEALEEKWRRAREARRKAHEAAIFQAQVECSLRRGEYRKKMKAFSEKWEAYLSKWDTLAKDTSRNVAIASIPWPVESGYRKDINIREVERFFRLAPTGGDPTETQLVKVLKVERIRWHPDKIQQKLGGQEVNKEVMEAVTAVFQIINRMWSQIRDRKH